MKLFLVFVINLISCLVHASEVIQFVKVDVDKLDSIDSVVVCTCAKINSGFEIKDLDIFLLLEITGKFGFEDWKSKGSFKTHEYYRQMERYKNEYNRWNRPFEDETIQAIAIEKSNLLQKEYNAFTAEHRRVYQAQKK